MPKSVAVLPKQEGHSDSANVLIAAGEVTYRGSWSSLNNEHTNARRSPTTT
jgi:hypothetical protein